MVDLVEENRRNDWGRWFKVSFPENLERWNLRKNGRFSLKRNGGNVSGHSRRRRLPLFVVIIVSLSPAIAMARLPRFSLLLFLSLALSTLSSTSRVIVYLFHFLPILLASSISPEPGSLVWFCLRKRYSFSPLSSFSVLHPPLFCLSHRSYSFIFCLFHLFAVVI
jgi:hypothetical protein